MQDLEKLRYPVGRLPRSAGPLGADRRGAEITVIERTPRTVRNLVEGIDEAGLAATYRPGAWTVRQLVHHMADSHINAYVRMKLAATEDLPPIKTYEEKLWAELPDGKSAPVVVSLMLLDALHQRWVAFLRALREADFARAFSHPEWGRVTIDESLVMYAWHCRHHTAHIEIALGRDSVV